MMTTYLFDISIFILLGITVLFCWRLNGKLLELKKSRGDMSKLVKVFDESIIRTNQSIAHLRDIATQASEELKKQHYKTHELIDQISFANDTSSRVLKRLEDTLSEASAVKSEIQLMGVMNDQEKKPKRRTSKKLMQSQEVVGQGGVV